MLKRFKYSEYPKSIRKNMIERDRRKDREEIESGSPKGKRKKAMRTIGRILLVILLILLIIGSAFFFLWAKGKKHMPKYDNIYLDTVDLGDNAPVIHDSGATIEYNGAIYDLNKNIVSFALLGVDKRELGLDDDVIGTGGQADTIAVAAYDTMTGKADIIVIPRDSMVDVGIYDVNGAYVQILKKQICVSYAYGDGREKSCENTLQSINRLLYGMPVDYYLAMDEDGISNLNDLLGGVTVTPADTFENFKKGETVTLHGEEAERYIRYRKTSELDSDSARRARQKQYIEKFSDKLIGNIKQDFTLVPKFYNQISEYTVTNVSLDFATYMATVVVNNNVKFKDFRTVPGEYAHGEKNVEYNVDSKALFELILDVYYTKRPS